MKPILKITTALLITLIIGCGGSESAQVCPYSTEYKVYPTLIGPGWNGVNLVIVVDSSESMGPAQSAAASALYTLVNSFAHPNTESGWPWGEVVNLRVAVITADMGLQYGLDHSTEGFPYGTEVPTCTDQVSWGDDGEFQTGQIESVLVESGLIACEPDGDQCPKDWACANGLCVSPSGDKEQVSCPPLPENQPWSESEEDDPNREVATQVACASQVGAGGCVIGQPLEAAIRGLEIYNESFLLDNNMLVVLVVSDKDDCSIADPGLFETPEWTSGIQADPDDPQTGLLTTACNLPESNEENYLFSIDDIGDQLMALKDGHARYVFFGAIAGVPSGDDSHCRGSGDELDGCLEHEDMQLEIGLEGHGYQLTRRFEPACELKQGDDFIISASPGRRYVKLAQSFGKRGFISSICDDPNDSMRDFAWIILDQAFFGSPIITEPVEWIPLSGKQQEEMDCPGCGMPNCEMIAVFTYSTDDDRGCPEELGLDPDKVAKEYLKDHTGQITQVEVYCPVPKLPAELDCESAKARLYGSNEIGWYYCEDNAEDFDQNCSDGIDNDGDGGIDCEDEKCKGCKVCGGDGKICDYSRRVNTWATASTFNALRGSWFQVQCPENSFADDENCQENSKKACNDGVDNDGNGAWDCTEGLTPDAYQFPDPNCCPMHVEGNMCIVENKAFENCGGDLNNLPPACEAHANLLNCELPN